MSRTIAYSSQELVDQYQYLSSGHFFDADTMRFFNSRVTSNYRRIDDTRAFFITTESFSGNSGERFATVRHAELVKYIRAKDGREVYKIEIHTVKDFNKLSLAKAKRLMNQLE